jgi:hypothetical protein
VTRIKLAATAETAARSQGDDLATVLEHQLRLQEAAMRSTHNSHRITLSSQGIRRARRVTSLALTGCVAVLLLQPIGLDATSASPDQVLERFLATAARKPVSYRAVRRLEGSNAKMKMTGWVEALTEFDPDTGLRYQILAEEGAGRVRGLLKKILEGEREATHPARSISTGFSLTNYSFEPGPVGENGVVAVRVKPRRQETSLVNGTIFLSAADGGLVRVEGRLAKSPSFWTRSVDVTQRFERRAGVLVPVEVQSLADIRIAGPSTFVMSYGYESVNGQTPHDAPMPTLVSARLDIGVTRRH